MEEYTPLKSQFYCNTCHTRFDKGRDAIAAHERSEKHKRAKGKATKEIIRQARNKGNEFNYDKEVQFLENRNKKLFRGEVGGGVKSSTVGGSQGGQGGSGPATSAPPGKQNFKGPQGKKKEADPAFIPSDLGVGFDKSNKKYHTAWKLMKDPETGKLCFYNNISGGKFFERPRGVKLTEDEEKKWEEYQLHKDEIKDVDVLLNPEIQETNIGGWEAVDPAEDYYKANAVDPEEEKLLAELEEDPDDVQLEEKLENLEELNEEERENLLDLDKPELGKSMLKAKSDKLRTLIESNFEIVSKPTFKKTSDVLFKEAAQDNGDEPPKKTKDVENKDAPEVKSGGMFKKRQAKVASKTLNELHKDSDEE